MLLLLLNNATPAIIVIASTDVMVSFAATLEVVVSYVQTEALMVAA